MVPGAHLLASWVLSDSLLATRRERRWATLAGLMPDLDGLGVVADFLTKGRTECFATYHHLLAHNLPSGLVMAALASAFVKTRKLRLFGVCLVTFHLHLACDLLGSKGPDGELWPIHYLFPFDSKFELAWRGQWLLNGWQNLLILGLLFLVSIHLAVRKRHSFLEVFSGRLDEQLFRSIRNRS